MDNTAIIAVMPIGEFDSELVKNEFEAILGVFHRLKAELVVSDAVSNEEEARQSIWGLSERNPDLLLIIPLRGLSAPVIETARRTSSAPCLVWPVQGRFALPSSSLAVGALQAKGVPIELHHAPPDHVVSIERIHCIVSAAKAYNRIMRSRIGVIGGLFPNLVSCRYDPQIINNRLGITILPISFNEVHNSIQTISNTNDVFEQSRDELMRSFEINPLDENALDAGIKLHLALRRIAEEQKIGGFAFECWTGFPRELGMNPCMGFVEDAYTIACEGDVMCCISLLITRYLTGTSPYVGDLFDLDMDGTLTLVHCGAPASLAFNKGEVVLAKSQPALDRGFETMTCRPRLKPGPVTIFRFYGQDCDRMHVALGDLLDSELSFNLTVKAKLTGDRWDFLNQCFGNHYLVVAGDIRNELRLLGKWLGINISET